MKAIWTKYIPATDKHGARVKASAEGVRSHTVSFWSCDGNVDETHAYAARELARREGWTGTLISGGRPDGKGDVFVFAESAKWEI